MGDLAYRGHRGGLLRKKNPDWSRRSSPAGSASSTAGVSKMLDRVDQFTADTPRDERTVKIVRGDRRPVQYTARIIIVRRGGQRSPAGTLGVREVRPGSSHRLAVTKATAPAGTVTAIWLPPSVRPRSSRVAPTRSSVSATSGWPDDAEEAGGGRLSHDPCHHLASTQRPRRPVPRPGTRLLRHPRQHQPIPPKSRPPTRTTRVQGHTGTRRITVAPVRCRPVAKDISD